MPGKLRGAIVFIEDEREANRIHNRGYPGTPLSGGSLKIGLIEAAFLMDEKGFEIEGIESLVDLFHYSGKFIPDFEVHYLVYRILKLRGFIVKIPDSHFEEDRPEGMRESKSSAPPLRGVREPYRLLPRGSRPSVPAFMHVLPISERDEFLIDRFVVFSRECVKRGVEGLLGVVDEDGDVTFYSLKAAVPEGDCELLHTIMVNGKIGQSRVLVPLGDEGKLLAKDGFFGQVMGSMLHLSFIEAIYLFDKGLLDLGETSREELHRRAGEAQSDIELRYPIFRLLRDRGIRVKTGFKYGTHFRAYSGDPDRSHADFLVHVIAEGAKVDWQEISRGIRVAHGVKKKIIFTNPEMVEGSEFLELTWVRP